MTVSQVTKIMFHSFFTLVGHTTGGTQSCFHSLVSDLRLDSDLTIEQFSPVLLSYHQEKNSCKKPVWKLCLW